MNEMFEMVWREAVRKFPHCGEVEQQIAYIKRQYGLTETKKHRPHRRHNPFAIVAAYRRHGSFYSTAKALGISTNLVYYWVKRLQGG